MLVVYWNIKVYWLNFDNNVRKNWMRFLVKNFFLKLGVYNYMMMIKDERMLWCYSFYIVYCRMIFLLKYIWYDLINIKGRNLCVI